MAKLVEIQSPYDLEPGAGLTIGQPPEAQRLRLLEHLGGGITSQVWRAETVSTEGGAVSARQGPLAIKLMTLAVERPEKDAFMLEALTLTQLASALSKRGDPPGDPANTALLVPRVLGQSEQPWPAYILMSLAAGTPLDKRLGQDRYLTEKDGLLAAEQLCLLFCALHEDLERSYPDFQLHNIFWDADARRICVVGWDLISPPGEADFQADIANIARLVYRILVGLEYSGQLEAGVGWSQLSAPAQELLAGWLQDRYTSFAALHARLVELNSLLADEAAQAALVEEAVPAEAAEASPKQPLEKQAGLLDSLSPRAQAVYQELQAGDPSQFGQQSSLHLGEDPELSRAALDTLKGLYQAGQASRASAGLEAVLAHLAPGYLDEAQELQQRLQESAAWQQILQQVQLDYTQKTGQELRSTPYYQAEIQSGLEKLALAPADEPVRAAAWRLAVRIYFEEKLPSEARALLFERVLLRLEPQPGAAEQARQANSVKVPLTSEQAERLEKITALRTSIGQPETYASHAELQLAIDQLAEAMKEAQYLPMFPSLTGEISAQIQALYQQHERLSENERLAEIQRLCAQAEQVAQSELDQELQDALGLLAQASQLALGLPARQRRASHAAVQVQIEQVNAKQVRLERSSLLAQARLHQQAAEKLAAPGDSHSLEAASQKVQEALHLAEQMLGDKSLAGELQAQLNGYQSLLESQRATRILAQIEADLQAARQAAAIKTIHEQESAVLHLGRALAAAQDELHDAALVKTIQDEQQGVEQELLLLQIAGLRQKAEDGLRLQTLAGCELARQALQSALELAKTSLPEIVGSLEEQLHSCGLTQAWLRYTEAGNDIHALEQRARKQAGKDSEAGYTEAAELLEQALSRLGTHTWEGKALDPETIQRLEKLRDDYRHSASSKRTHLVIQRLGEKEQEAQRQLEQRTPASYREAKKVIEAAVEIARDELKDSERAQALEGAVKEVEREIQVHSGGPPGYGDRITQAEQLCEQKVLSQIQQAMPLYTQAAEVARKTNKPVLVEHAESRIEHLKKVITRSALLRRQISQHRQQQNFPEALKGIDELQKIGVYGFEKPDDLENLRQYIHFEAFEMQFLEAYSGWSVKLPAGEKASRAAQMGQALEELEKLASGLDDNQQRRLVEYRKNYVAVK